MHLATATVPAAVGAFADIFDFLHHIIGATNSSIHAGTEHGTHHARQRSSRRHLAANVQSTGVHHGHFQFSIPEEPHQRLTYISYTTAGKTKALIRHFFGSSVLVQLLLNPRSYASRQFSKLLEIKGVTPR